jgi:hypothetical protein
VDGVATEPGELQCVVIPIEPTQLEIQSFRERKKVLVLSRSNSLPQYQSRVSLAVVDALVFLTH